MWDYAGDNYVHRLVQNKADGKLVEVDEQGNRFHEKKMDQISLEVLDDCIFQMYIKGCHFLSIVFLFQPNFFFFVDSLDVLPIIILSLQSIFPELQTFSIFK